MFYGGAPDGNFGNVVILNVVSVVINYIFSFCQDLKMFGYIYSAQLLKQLNMKLDEILRRTRNKSNFVLLMTETDKLIKNYFEVYQFIRLISSSLNFYGILLVLSSFIAIVCEVITYFRISYLILLN
jgi:hypothetical protein